jgi:hypothetical protein
MPVTFSVANTSPVHEITITPLDSLFDAINQIVGVRPEAVGTNVESLISLYSDRIPNSFVRTVHSSFDLHLPLVLSPDDIWLVIAQGFAAHVYQNAEKLRHMFVQHEGKAILRVQRDFFVKGSPDNDWPGVFGEFSDGIAAHIGEKRDLLVSRFSTTGPVEKAASEVVLMDAMQSFFEYRVYTCCGIPTITLLGTREDWESVQNRARGMAQFDCQGWVNALVKVLEHFVAAFDGKQDGFWGSFYKSHSGSGGPHVSGAINVFFPYLKNGKKNPAATDWANTWWGGGPSPNDYPPGLSSAPFFWHYYDNVFNMQFLGGFVGVSQDTTLAVRPAIGWAVADAK